MCYLVKDVDRYNKIRENIIFKHAIDFDDDLVAVLKVRCIVKLNKFNYFGFFVLDKAKLFINKAIFDYFKESCIVVITILILIVFS